MNKIFRLLIVIALVAGIAVLATNRIVWASGPAHEANQSTLASLTGFVWNDSDRDGVQDVGENGIAKVIVNLYDSAKILVNTVITDETGHYKFDSLTPGNYYINFEAPAGFITSPKDQGKNEALDSDVDIITHQTIPATLVAGANTQQWDIGLYRTGIASAIKPGTVKPPPGEVTTCENGIYSVGGVSTLEVTDLAPGYCIVAFLRNHAFALGRIPDGAGKILARITFVRVFYHGMLLPEVAAGDGEVQICYAIPPGKNAQIYFFDFYGPRFGERTGQPAWELLETTIDGGLACASAETTGAYALIGN